jgi:hypothetical protein
MSDLGQQLEDPRNKQELRENIVWGGQMIEKIINSLSPQGLAEPGPDGGWSVKDHIAHLATWHGKAVSMMEGTPDYELMGLTKEESDQNDTDGINAIIYQHNRDKTLDQVLQDYRRTQQQVLDVLDAFPEKELMREYPSRTSSDVYHLQDFIIGNTYGHVQEHLEWIDALLKSRQKGKME